MRIALPGPGRLRVELQRLRLSLDLLLGRKIWVLGAIDALILVSAFFEAAVGGTRPEGVFVPVVIFPIFLLGIPALSDSVSLERRAGSLDLALSAPSASGYFLRRTAAFAGLLGIQGCLVMSLYWIVADWPKFPILYVWAQVLLDATALGLSSLLWSLRMKTAGGAAIASTLTVAALWKWISYTPIPDPTYTPSGPFVLPLDGTLEFLGNAFILASAIGVLALYCRRRILQPESLVS